MARPIQSETRDLWHSTRAGGAQDTGADRSAPASGPTDAEHFASVYGRYGEVYVAGGSGPDLLNASFWGDDGGDTFSGITGGVGSGNLANGYSGKFTNNYGGSIQFVGMEQFNVSTGKQDDNFKVGDGDDTVNSGAGNDTIDSGKGVDVIFGGDNTGYDRWIADKGFATDAIVIDFTANTAQSYLGTGQVSGIESIFLKTGSGNDVIIGYAAEFNANSINTGAGDDQVTVGNYGRYGDNTVVGGMGTDTLTAIFTGSGPNGGDTFGGYTGGVTAGNFADGYAGKFQNGYGGNFTFSGIEHFSVTTGAANDTFKTGDGDDTVTSNGGDDSFDTGKGIDVVDGGIGTDRWTADKSFAIQNINLNITLAGPQAYLGTGSVNSIESLFLKTGAGNDKITAYVSGLDNAISTGDGDDQITLGLYGRYGTDFVAGGEGSDRMTFTWTGDGGGDTFGQVTGGITAGKLNKGYAGALTNSYGGNLTFTGIETFRITTGLQNDNIKTGDGNDTVDTGAGNDAIDSGGGADVVRGGDGTDYWIANKALVSEDITVDLTAVGTQTYMTDGTVSGIEALNLTTGSGDDVVRTLQAELGDTVNSGRGNDLVTLANSGRYGNDSADGGLGSDRLVVLNTGDVFAGLTGGVTGGDLAGGYSGLLNSGYGTTFTFAGFENFSFITGIGDDHMTSGDGKDLLDSREGNDVLDGAGGADTLIGGAGHDTLTGGAGNDIFRYLAVADSAPGLSDYLADFVEGADRIDFAAIDAKSGTPQDNAFSFIGTAAFTHHAGELRYSSDGTYTYVQGDVNGDGTVDIEVLLGGVHTLAGGDFVL